ncbi:hypothetical protein [Streptomyces sp. NPDC002952]|uniref:hypothetical protein n=1 Tax=Streptomyces sp. NPDC002952 TaxID=3364673 RepID=UPI0036CFE618
MTAPTAQQSAGSPMGRGTRFRETMTGTTELPGESRPRPTRLHLTATAAEVMRPHRTTTAAVTGRIRIAGWAEDAEVTGELEISPLARRRIRYRLEFTNAQGRAITLDGWKSVSLRSPLRSMTVLPYCLYRRGIPVGRGTLRLPLGQLLPFLVGFRFPATTSAMNAPRWQGAPGRLDVWYTTLTDPVTGTGVWLHHELVAPADGGPPHAHGWAAVFPRQGPVRHARFGPAPWAPEAAGFTSPDASYTAGRLRGSAGDISWDLTERPSGDPVFTFPRWSWRWPLLPAAQVLPAARALYDGTLTIAGVSTELASAPGASARIYGHGHARRWGWLHADLGGGDVLEVVAAASDRPGTRALPPLVFLRLRRAGRTWPRRAERTAMGWAGWGRFRAELGRPVWRVRGRAGLRRVRVEVTLPPGRTLTLPYRDPDGSGLTCHNSESADATVVLERWWGRWREERRWVLDGTAHAELGER